MKNNKCKICRRHGTKLFLKGEKCLSVKCPVIKKPYPPGIRKKKRGAGAFSEYGKELKEKQKLKNWYNLKEGQLRKYVKESSSTNLLIRALENRFDNVIFHLGLSVSRTQARQFISHGHFLINNKPVNIPSYQLKKGDKITIKAISQKSKTFANSIPLLKKHQTPSWLKLDPEKLEGEIIALPTLEEANPPAELSTIFEYYSR